MLTISFFGILQNAIFLVLYHKRIIDRSQTLKIYAMLATIDLLSSITSAPIHATQSLAPQLATNCALDATRVQISAATNSMSSYCVCLIAYDRYRMIAKPHRSRMHTRKLYGIFIVIAIIAVTVPAIRLIPHTVALKIYSSIVLLNGTTIIVLISLSYHVLLRMLKKHNAEQPKERKKANDIREKEVTKIAITIISIYIAMLFPCLIYHIFIYTAPERRITSAKIYVVAIISLSINSTLNPIIYYFANEHIRNKLIYIVHHNDVPQNNEPQTDQVQRRIHITNRYTNTQMQRITTIRNIPNLDNSSTSSNENHRPITVYRRNSLTLA